MINHAFRSATSGSSWAKRLPMQLYVIVTFVAVLLGWVMFRADTISAAAIMFEALLNVGPAAPANQFAPGVTDWAKLTAALATIWLLPNSYQIFASITPALGTIPPMRPAWAGWRPSATWAIIIACCFAAATLPNRAPLSFLYFQF